MEPAKTSLDGREPQLLALIPARAGSKGIPGKNMRLFAGRPLLAHAVACAVQAGIFNRIVLTTNSEEMAGAGRAAGAEVPFLRPAELAQDDTPMLPVMQHAVRYLEATGWVPDLIVLLQPTAPFRRVPDLVKAVELLRASPNLDSVVSVEEIPAHFSPHMAMKVEGQRLVPFLPEGLRVTRRQDAPKAYTRNGQFYVTRRQVLMEENSIYGDHCQPFITTHPAINLDTMEDWAAAEQLIRDIHGLPR
jgi:N-acylneuraminate cytidylyltransferase